MALTQPLSISATVKQEMRSLNLTVQLRTTFKLSGVLELPMGREVKLSRIMTVLSDSDYPVSRETVVERYGDMTILLADGEVNFGTIIAEVDEETFHSVD